MTDAPRPSHRPRRILIVAGVALLLLVGIAAALPFLIDVNRYRPLIQRKAEEALGRKVSLGHMKLSLFPSAGIAIDSPQVEGFVRARSLTVGARLMPLLSGRVELKRVILDRPEITLTRNADGQWDLPSGPARAEGGAAQATPPQPFSLAALTIQDGTVHLQDRAGARGVAPPPPLVIPFSLSTSLSRDTAGTLGAVGHLELQGLQLQGMPRPIDAAAEFDVTAKQEAKLLQIRRLVAEVGRSHIEVKGTVDNRKAGTVVDLEVPPATVAAEDLAQLLALTGVAAGVELDAGDPVRLKGAIRGDVASGRDLKVSGEVSVSGASFRHPSMTRPLESIHGTVTLRNDGFSVGGFSATIGGSDVAGTLSVTDLDAPDVRFDLSSKRADFMELLSILEPGPAAPAKGGAGSAPGPSMISRLRARGKLSIAEGSFGSLRFSSLGSTLALERQVAHLENVSMKLYGGAVEGKVSVDLGANPLACAVEARPRGIDVGAMLEENLGMGEMLDGTLSGRLAISASGASRDAVLRAAQGEGEVRIENGRVGALNVLSILGRASDVLGERSLKQVSEKLAKEGTDFSLMTAGLRVGGGRVTTDNLLLASPDLELRDDGALDLLAATIRMEGEILFSEALSQAMVDERSKAADYFWDTRQGRVNLPLTLSGPIDAPTPGIDWNSAGGRLARRKVEEKLQERLEATGLAGILGERGGKLPVRQSPPATVSGGGGEAAAGGPVVAIGESRFSGNFLVPDLKIKGNLTGTSITAARVIVKDGKGRVVMEESLMEAVEAHYASHDRSTSASIPFRAELDGKKLAAAGRSVQVAVVVEDAEGRVTEHPVEARR